MRPLLKHISIALALLSVLEVEGQNIRLAAEWEPQKMVHMAWFGNDRRDTVLLRVIQALQPTVPITLNIPNENLSPDVKVKLANYDIDTSRISYVYDPDTDFWTRDPLFFVSDNGHQKVVCFNYSMYGIFPLIAGQQIPEDIVRIGEYDERLARHLNLPIIKSDFVFEGGSIETNGQGTFLVIREMALQRNPSKSLKEIEEELQRTLGARKIIWLNDGLIEDRTFKNFGPFYRNYFGGGANMHIDELCRFVDERTVLLPSINRKDIKHSPVDSINYYILEKNYEILKKATTYTGEKLRIKRVPVPEIEQLKFIQILDSTTVRTVSSFGFNVGDTIYRVPATGYINYFVSNDVVLIPKYWKPGMTRSQQVKDEKARKMFARLFPGRRVVQIYSLSINRGGGGIHCMTHEQPVSEN